MYETRLVVENQRFDFSVGIDFSFPVIFTHDVFAENNMTLAEIMGRGAKFGVIADSGILDFLPTLSAKVSNYAWNNGLNLRGLSLMPGGEKAKQGFAVVEQVLSLLSQWKICRHSYVVVLGGGALLDAAGLACSLAHRGVRIIRLPSTALAQGDSGVGVKNGVNLFGQKNFAGTFHPPYAVINDLDLLSFLPVEMLLEGVAEALKVALIKDRDFFHDILVNAELIAEGDLHIIEKIIVRSANIHSEHIAAGGDPFELGGARPLDFGHWAAHKLELLTSHRLRHGAAVAIGIMLDSLYAKRVGLITRNEFYDIHAAFAGCGLKIYDSALSETDSKGRLKILSGIEDFREHLGGALAVTLPDGIGSKTEVSVMDEALLAECVAHLRVLSERG